MDLSTAKLGTWHPSGHLCFPYESELENQKILIAFVREGLARRDRCLHIGTREEQATFLVALEAAGVAVERARGSGALVLATQADIYLRKGHFDGDDALVVMEELVDRALADGFVGLRATGEASSPVPDALWPDILRYEARLNEGLSRRPFLALCRFHTGKNAPGRTSDMLRTHPHVLVRGEVCANPFYERPEVALGNDGRARLDWQLHQVRTHHRARKRLEALAAQGTPSEVEGALERALHARDRFLTTLADELAEPLFALKREVHALGTSLDEIPQAERLDAAQRHLRRLSAAVAEAREVARLSDLSAGVEAWGESDEDVDDGGAGAPPSG